MPLEEEADEEKNEAYYDDASLSLVMRDGGITVFVILNHYFVNIYIPYPVNSCRLL
jgi:hypothetical protein